jgi:hypothetical protein
MNEKNKTHQGIYMFSDPSILPVSSNQPDNQFEILFDDEHHPAKTYYF